MEVFMKRVFTVLLILLIVAGLIGAGVSVGLVISAVQFGELGRVVFYCVTLAICVEMAVLAALKLKNKETA